MIFLKKSKYKEVFQPEKTLQFIFKEFASPDSRSFVHEQNSIPSAGVHIIKKGKFIGGREEVFYKTNIVFDKITSQKVNPFAGEIVASLNCITYIEKKVAYFSLSGLENNYYHFLIEFMARWFILSESRLCYDVIVIPKTFKYINDFIFLSNIPKDKILFIESDLCYQAKELMIPDLINNWEFEDYGKPFNRHCAKQWLPNWLGLKYKKLNRLSNELPINKSERIYISRKKASKRFFINEEEVEEFVEKKGFSVVVLEDISFYDQIQLFSNAKAIIAPHGAGLVNMIFAKNTISVLEIYPSNYLDPSFRLLSKTLNHDYEFIISESEKFKCDLFKVEKWINEKL